MNAMQRKLAGVIAFAFAIALLVWRLHPVPEPVYNSKPLSAWVQQYSTNNWRPEGRPAAQEAEVAIRQIGTNAIPLLLDRIRVRESPLKKKVRTFVPQSWQDRLYLRDRTEETRSTGAYGLAALGTNAPSAVPALIEIGTHHPDEDGRSIAVYAVGTLGSAAEPAIPFLIQCLTNKVFMIRSYAASGLGNVQRQPEIVVPALTQYLDFTKASPHMVEPTAAIASLARFGIYAKPAVPFISSFLTNPVPIFRKIATNALSQIGAEPTVSNRFDSSVALKPSSVR